MAELAKLLMRPRNLNDLELVIEKGKKLVTYIDKHTFRHQADPHDYLIANVGKMQQNAEAAKNLLEVGYGASALQFARLFIEDFFNISYLLKNPNNPPVKQLEQFHDHKTLAKPIQYVRLLEELGTPVNNNDKQNAEQKLAQFKSKYHNSEGRKGWALLNLAEMSKELSELNNDSLYKDMYTLMYSLFSEDTHGLSAPFIESTKGFIGIEASIYNQNYRSEETVTNISLIYNDILDLITGFYEIQI